MENMQITLQSADLSDELKQVLATKRYGGTIATIAFEVLAYRSRIPSFRECVVQHRPVPVPQHTPVDNRTAVGDFMDDPTQDTFVFPEVTHLETRLAERWEKIQLNDTLVELPFGKDVRTTPIQRIYRLRQGDQTVGYLIETVNSYYLGRSLLLTQEELTVREEIRSTDRELFRSVFHYGRVPQKYRASA